MISVVRACTVVAAAASLAACGSLGVDLSSGLSRSGVVAPLQLESDPPGAEAKTSVGPGCRTPCTVNVPADREFTVSFTLDGYEPATESVKPVLPDDGRIDIEAPTQPPVELSPNPVYAQLQPASPPPKKRARTKPRAQTPARSQVQAAQPAPEASAPAQQTATGNWPSPGQTSSTWPAPAQSSPAWPAPQQTAQ